MLHLLHFFMRSVQIDPTLRHNFRSEFFRYYSLYFRTLFFFHRRSFPVRAFGHDPFTLTSAVR